MSEGFNKVGVVGLGIIGKGVTDILRQQDLDVYVWNRTPKPEPNFLGSPDELARVVDIIQIYVTDGNALLTILGQMRDSLGSRHVVLNHSTVDPQSSVDAYQICREAGANFLDAPFTGSKDAAAQGQLTYYVGGEMEVLEQVRSILNYSAGEIIHVGRIGEASILKIATNMISAATVAALSEAYGLTTSAGLDPTILKEAIESNACGSVLTKMKLPTIINGNYEPHFSLNNMFKDSSLALHMAKGLGIDLPVTTTTANVMYRSMKDGHGDKDYSSLGLNYQSK